MEPASLKAGFADRDSLVTFIFNGKRAIGRLRLICSGGLTSLVSGESIRLPVTVF